MVVRRCVYDKFRPQGVPITRVNMGTRSLRQLLLDWFDLAS